MGRWLQLRGTHSAISAKASRGFSTFSTLVGAIIVFSLGVTLVMLTFEHGNAAGSDRGGSVATVPDFAYEHTSIRGSDQAYQLAIDMPGVLRKIPCFCGCGLALHHQNSLDCFVAGRKGSQIDFNEHGATCPICINIALDVRRLTAEDKDPDEIRQAIIDKYSSQGISTDLGDGNSN